MMGAFSKAEFMARFRDETAEHLANLERGLLSLEAAPGNRKLIEDMMREAHTMKGAAGMMDLKVIARLSHEFEDSLLSVTNAVEQEHGDSGSFEKLFAMLDAVASALESVDDVDTDAAGPVRDAAAVSGPVREAAVAAGPVREAAAVSGPVREAAAAARPPSGPLKPATADAPQQESVRVAIDKLDDLMNLVGELVTAKTRLDKKLSALDEFARERRELNATFRATDDATQDGQAARETAKRLGRSVDELRRASDALSFAIAQTQDSVMGIRMLPLEVILRRFPRAVRDLAREEGKSVQLEISGEETELDKTVLERVRDPLMHILRNAVGHGVEPPLVREERGKSPTGTIRLHAYCRGSQVIIEIEDDGQGIDCGELRATAVDRGVVSADDAARMPDGQVLDLLFLPGFSTSECVSELSGRGVGLDVVKAEVTRLKGEIEIESKRGSGTRFTLRLPLTLAVTVVLLADAGGQTYALPLDSVEETLRIDPKDVRRIQGRDAVCVRDEIVPLVALSDALATAGASGVSRAACFPAVIVSGRGGKLALGVDRLGTRADVVTKSLGSHLVSVKHVSGATLLGDGLVVPVLDVGSLVRDAAETMTLPAAAAVEPSSAGRGAVLVVDDSVITRDLERSILQAAGYSVDVAANGAEGLGKLAERAFDLVLTDVSMPVMDGLAMIETMRSDKRYGDIPAVVVSSRETDEERLRGLDAGASAYLGKRSFDQVQLLETVQRLIG